jgi:hypothetical protein
MPPPERACAAHNAVTRLEVVDDAALIARIERCFSEVRSVAMETHDKIGYTNIFHAAWSDEANARYAPVLEGILDRINAREGGRLAARDVLNAGFIYAAPNNQRQTFHYDYGNTTDTYFLPLVELSDRNGTELLHFHDAAHYETHFPILDAINNRYTSADDVRAHLARARRPVLGVRVRRLLGGGVHAVQAAAVRVPSRQDERDRRRARDVPARRDARPVVRAARGRGRIRGRRGARRRARPGRKRAVGRAQTHTLRPLRH